MRAQISTGLSLAMRRSISSIRSPMRVRAMLSESMPIFRAAMGNRIYGCDDCLAVCPWNRFAEAAAANRAFLPRAELAAPRLADLLALDDAGFREMFAGSPIKRVGRNRMVRNAAIAAGNSGEAELIPMLQRLTGDEDAVVAEAATWALERLSASAAAP